MHSKFKNMGEIKELLKKKKKGNTYLFSTNDIEQEGCLPLLLTVPSGSVGSYLL